MQRMLIDLRAYVLMAIAVIALLASSGVTFGYPTPHRVPVRWELDFHPGELRLYVDRDTQAADPAAYWYFTYKIVNNTSRERFWAPRLTLFTDKGDIMNSGQGVPPHIEVLLIERMRNEYLARQNQVIGKIFPGEANAVECLVVWPADNLDVTELDLFISGISGETAQVENPMTHERQILQKTLVRKYLVPGDIAARRDDPAELLEQDWVMR